MDNDLIAKLDAQEKKIDALYASVEKMRKYFLITLWLTVVLFVVPLLSLIFVIPMFVNSYLGTLEGLL